MYVLGIDGGGTKTTGVIANEQGKVFGEVTVGATNPNSVQQAAIKDELTKVQMMLRDQTGPIYSQVKSVFAGISGVGHPSAKQEMQDIIASSLDTGCEVTIDTDAITALYSGTMGEPGIVQIAGTGSISFGLNHQGNRDRVGGWGYLIGEYGSGFAVGRDGLEAAFLAHDKVKAPTEIHDHIVSHFQLDALPDSIHLIYQAKNSKELIASLSKLVVKATDNGDHVAEKIIRKNGIKIGESITSLIQKLFTEQERAGHIPVVLTGGLFNRLDLFKTSIEEVLSENHIFAQLITPKVEPVAGAIIAGLRTAGVKINKDFADHFHRSAMTFDKNK